MHRLLNAFPAGRLAGSVGRREAELIPVSTLAEPGHAVSAAGRRAAGQARTGRIVATGQGARMAVAAVDECQQEMRLVSAAGVPFGVARAGANIAKGGRRSEGSPLVRAGRGGGKRERGGEPRGAQKRGHQGP